MQAYCLCKNGKANRLSRLYSSLYPFQSIHRIGHSAGFSFRRIRWNWELAQQMTKFFFRAFNKKPPNPFIYYLLDMLLLWFLLLTNLMLMLPNFEGGLLAAATTEVWQLDRDNPDFYNKVASFEGESTVSSDENYYADNSGQQRFGRFRR